MPATQYTPQEAVRLGQELYDREIRAQVEPGNRGNFIVIDIESGHYTVGPEYHALAHEVLSQKPGAALCILRIGYEAVGRIGGRFARRKA